MSFVSLTRLRVRSVRFMPSFVVHTLRSLGQIREAPGFERGMLLADRRWTFWTMTAWESQERMRAYMISGSHKEAMPKLQHWCDEASVAHWTQPDEALPTWVEADGRMRAEGRISKVLHPSPEHAGMGFRAPRATVGGPIRRR